MLKHRPTILAACVIAGSLAVQEPSSAQGAPVQVANAAQKEKASPDFELRLNLPRTGSGALFSQEEERERLKKLKEQTKPTGKVPGEPDKTKKLNQDVADIEKQIDQLTKSLSKEKSAFKDRQRKQVRSIKKRFGSLLKLPGAKRVLEEHGQKLAKLQRVRYLAYKKQDIEALGRAEMLMAAERYLIKRRMELVEQGAKESEIFLPQYSEKTAKDDSVKKDDAAKNDSKGKKASANGQSATPAPAAGENP